MAFYPFDVQRIHVPLPAWSRLQWLDDVHMRIRESSDPTNSRLVLVFEMIGARRFATTNLFEQWQFFDLLIETI